MWSLIRKEEVFDVRLHGPEVCDVLGRNLCEYPIRSRNRSAQSIVAVLQNIMNHEWNKRPPKVVHSDAESAFGSEVITRSFWNLYRISQRCAPMVKADVYPPFVDIRAKNFAQHESMGLIDRLIRTTRDMAYQMGSNLTDPRVFHTVLNQYNHAMHYTLSQLAGFDISPVVVHANPDLEDRIVREVVQKNCKVVGSYGYDLPPGRKFGCFTKRRNSESVGGSFNLKIVK